MRASIKPVEEKTPKKGDSEFKATIDSIKEMALQIIQENPNIPSEASFAIKNIQSHSFLINFVSSNMNLSVKEKQQILSIADLQERAISCFKIYECRIPETRLKK